MDVAWQQVYQSIPFTRTTPPGPVARLGRAIGPHLRDNPDRDPRPQHECIAMDIFQQLIRIEPGGRGPREITRQVAGIVSASGMGTGLCHCFCRHTSASLTITENADPTVLEDLEGHMGRSVPDGDPHYAHAMEGPDDMSAHIRSVLTGAGLTVPFSDGRLALGTWQGIFLWEHRTGRHERQVVVTCLGR